MWWTAFKRGMSDLGYVGGKSIRYESRFGHSDFGRLPSLAEELVRLNPAVIVTAATEATQAAWQATERIPIVTGSGSDHVSSGFARTLARPGGNITGLTSLNPDLVGKRLDLLRELLPKMARIAVLWQSTSHSSALSFREVENRVQASGIDMVNMGVRKRADIVDALATATREHASAVFVIGSPLTYDERDQIASLARKSRMPAIGTSADFAVSGLLISYGVDFLDLFVRAAGYVDKILKGTKPGDLPIEQPTKFELALNNQTARELGIKFPSAILLRADRVIE
jgi:putative ABC transport system substrate-binding protein